MTELSVNISAREREQIKEKALSLMLKTAVTRHPNPEFYQDITKEIFLHHLNKTSGHLDSPLIPYVHKTRLTSLGTTLKGIYFNEGTFIYSLDDSTTYTDLLRRNSRLKDVDASDINIPESFILGKDVLFPISEDYHNKLNIPNDLMQDIIEYNDKMEEIYEALDLQITTLLNAINTCRTTKTFYRILPDLKSLLSTSVLNKINRKNESFEEEELTEEQKLMMEATNAIATANLIGD